MAVITACWKKGLVTFLIYYALLFIGAAVMMYLEADGLGSQNEFNATKELENFFTSKFNLSFNDSSLKDIMKLSSSLSSKMASREKQEWKKTISWKTFYKWRYFTHITLTTVGEWKNLVWNFAILLPLRFFLFSFQYLRKPQSCVF